AAVAGVLAAAVACGGGSSGQTGGGGGGGGSENAVTITVGMTEYEFNPKEIDVKAGQTVTIKLVNQSKQDKDHEFKIGQDLVKGGDFGDTPLGYNVDFFKGLTVTWEGGSEVEELRTGEATVQGGDAAELIQKTISEAGPLEAGEPNAFVVSIGPGGTAQFSFTVPDSAVGTWEFGCFEEDGQHYIQGMHGQFVVTK
ncbi:MAG: cupredoxin domain-containing protein, partial [Clostridia bacterium]|nr:cupredoxin domain-containing protein [Clostridia bacterium]